MLFTAIRSSRRSGPRVESIAGSAFVHVLFFAWLFAAPWAKAPSTYTQVIRPQETKLVWYNFKKKLPDVSPSKRDPENRPLRAENLEKQTIISAPADAPKAPQMIFHPVPEVKPQPPTPLPNLIALAAPPPPRREFVAPQPRPIPQPAVQKVAELTPAPELRPQITPVTSASTLKMPAVSRPFTPPAERRPKLALKVDVAPAPELAANPTAFGSNAAKVLDQASRTLAFRPAAKPSATASIGSLPDAPVIAGANSATANVAVVGLNAVDNLNVPLPAGSRKAQFSGGPKLNPEGAASAGNSSGLTVPDLFVRGGEKHAEPTLIARAMSPAYNAPTSAESLRDLARNHARDNPAPEEIGRPSGTRVSGAPDPRFLGRQVFSVAIQSPNLTSHEGSWLMWYSDRASLSYRAVISAPQPLHKVDPKYIPTAVEDHVEGTVRLAFVIGRDGRVYGVETVKGIDDRLDHSAIEALQKWTFTPAYRENQPVDVDALVEIPFRLAPPPGK